MMNRITVTACLLLTASFCYAKKVGATPDKSPLNNIRQVPAQQPLVFWENKGQITDQDNKPRSDIQYRVAAANGLNIFIGDGAIHYQFTKCENAGDIKDAAKLLSDKRSSDVKPIYTAYRMDVELVGANKHAKIINGQKQGAFENYYTASTGKNGAKVNSYSKITYQDIYPNIDWVLYSKAGKLKHEFVVKKGGKVSDIKLKYGGADNVKLNTEGHLIAQTTQGMIDEDAPYCFQRDGKTVTGHFHVAGNVVSYDIAPYTGDLVIDPSLAWIVYFGPTGTDASMLDDAQAVTTDAAGNVYMAGYTKSVSGLATSGAYATTYSGGLDAFLAKYDDAGVLQWATYYGGIDYDIASSVAADPSGTIYMAGYTSSAAGIATPGSYQDTYSVGAFNATDAYLVAFDNTGARLWGTYYGGSGDEFAYALTADPIGNIYMAGSTSSASGIATTGAYQETFEGVMDGFLVKFNSLGTPVWATYFGGPGDDRINAVRLDNAGNPCVAGNTASATGIATMGAYQGLPGSANDAFLAKFYTGGGIVWATYYGGPGTDEAYALTSDLGGNMYIGGMTTSATAMASPGAYQYTRPGSIDGYVAKFDLFGNRVWGTYYGGASADVVNAMTTDSYGYICIAGQTASPSGIATADAYQAFYGDGWVPYDAFFARFDLTGHLDWGTYLGDYNIYEKAFGIAANTTGSVYVAGIKGNAVIPYDATPPSGDENAFLFKIDQTPSFSGPSAICEGSTVAFTDIITGGTWSSSDAGVISIDPFTGDALGVSHGTAMITYSLGSGTPFTRIIMVDTMLDTNPITGPSTICEAGGYWEMCATPGGVWTSSDPGIVYVAPNGGVTGMSGGTATITYSVSNSCGTMMVTKDMTVNPLPDPATISGATPICVGDVVPFTASVPGGTWSSSQPFVAITPGGDVTSTSAGTAVISYTVLNGCGMATATMTIDINAAPGVPVITGPSSVCVSSTITLGSSSLGGVWSIAPATIATISGGGVVSGVAPGTAIVSFTVTNSCGTASGTTIIMVNPLPVAGIISGTDHMCVGSSATFTDPTPGGTWTSGATSVATVSSAGVVSAIAVGTAYISYTVTNGCGSASAIYGVTVTTTPATGPISGADNICVSGSTVLTGASPGGAWTSGAPGVAIVSGSGLVTAISTGVATITYTAATICGTAVTTKTVTVNALPVAGSITGADLVCVSAPVTFIDPAAGGAWTSSSTAIATVSSAGLVSGVAEGVAVISYAVTNVCGTATATKSVTVNLMPDAGAITGVSTVCAGHTITMSDPAPGGIWSSSSANAVVTPTGAVIGIAPGTAIISYTVTNSCGTASVSHIVTVTPASACGTTGLALVSVPEFSLYPNPSNGTFTLVIPESVSEVNVIVTDMPGSVILSTTSKVTDMLAQVSLPNVAPGNYIVKVNTGINTYYQKITVLK